ncbi:MAG: YcxB family protein, partial [Proteobacteria bacterium]|nr:YcxB family protein [Pseudomonadota bacterium]
EVSYRLTPRGLVVRFGPEVVEIAWTELESWRESRRTFVFDLGGGRWYFLPRRFLDHGEDLTLRSWLDSTAELIPEKRRSK